MKRYLLLLPALLILPACTVSIAPGPPATIMEEHNYEESYYTFKGQVLNESGAPVPNVGVTMEERILNSDRRDNEVLTARTDNAGIFSFTVKRNRTGVIKINNELLVSESIRFRGPADSTPYEAGREDFSVVLEEGSPYERVANVERGRALEIRTHYSGMGVAFNGVRQLYGDQRYKEAAYEARSFLETFRNNGAYASEIRSIALDSEKRMREKMRGEFDALMALNDRSDFESVIYRGKDYIRDYSGVEDSRWEEVRGLVDHAKYSRHESEYAGRVSEDDRDRSDSAGERYGQEAVRSRGVDARVKYETIIGLKETDYDVIISQGKAYIEAYGGEEESRSREVKRLVSAAESRKKLAEDKERGLSRQEQIARDQAAKEQVAKEQAAKQQEQKNRDSLSKKFASADKAGKDPGAEAKKGPAEPAKAATAGGNIFKANCAACHGPAGLGTAMAPAFKGNSWVKSAAKGEIADTIRHGRQGGAKKYRQFAINMPSHKDMSESDVNALVEYLKSIN